jgi:hypothetical protein
MPIYSIKERSFASVKTIGKLRKGGPKPDGNKRPGPDLDRFRFTSDDPEVLAAFKAAYGTLEPKELHVYLPYAREEADWDYWFETWRANNRLVYRCDGRNWVKWLTEDGKAYSREPRPCPFCSGREKPRAGEHAPKGRLKLVLYELVKAGHAGVVLLETGAFSDIYSINSALLDVAQRRTDGRTDLTGIEFILRRELRDVPSREHGTQKRHVIVLEPVAEWIQAQLDRARPGLPPVDPNTGEILEEEEPPEPEEYDPFETGGDGQPAEPDMSWKTDKRKQAELEAKRKALGLTAQEAMTALGVERYSDFQGDMATMIQLMEDFAAWKKSKRGG